MPKKTYPLDIWEADGRFYTNMKDLETENGQPRRSDAWCRALGDQDAILEQAMEREDNRQ
jgi:hypothetical protein